MSCFYVFSNFESISLCIFTIIFEKWSWGRAFLKRDVEEIKKGFELLICL